MFKHLGKSYVTGSRAFQGTTPEIQAQAIGELEIASIFERGARAGDHQCASRRAHCCRCRRGRHPGYFSENFVVLADGPIKQIEDVKGKRVATNAIGSASDAAMRTMLHRHGIKDSDFTTVEANFANMPAMLEGGKVDMIGVLPQFAHGIIGNPAYKVLFTGKDAVGPTQAVVWAIRSDVIKAHRAAFVDFLEDHIRAGAGFSTRRTATRRSTSSLP